MSTALRRLSDAERAQWLRLARSENVGPATFAALRARYSDLDEALAALPALARRGGGGVPQIPAEADIAREIGSLARIGGRLIACCEPDFPPLLGSLDPPPPIIAVLGRTELLKTEMVAIVGARNASALGCKFASVMAAELGANGIVVASGLARGIDAAAHKGGLPTGTVAVVAGGADIVYPPENQTLYDAIKDQGALISEMPLGLAPLARHFPRRNRLISGLSRGVVVVEAALRSGSLITANYALEQGREIFAVPGSPLDPRSKGANRLIRDGATLTESADDVIQVLHPMLNRSLFGASLVPGPEPMAEKGGVEAISSGDADRLRSLLAEKIGPTPVDIDELIRQCGAPAPSVLTILLEWELAGRIERHPGNRIAWR